MTDPKGNIGADATGHDWWRGAAIYQIYPRSFQDTTGTGIGDLPGVRHRLAYVASLGVDAILLSPLFASPAAGMDNMAADLRTADPLLGSLDDFDAVVAQAHRLGLKVMIGPMPAAQAGLPDSLRFWLERGVDGFSFDALDRRDTESSSLLKHLRPLLDSYGAVAMGAGERDGHHMVEMPALTGKEFSAGAVRRAVEAFEARAFGWPCRGFSSPDVVRHVSRFAREGDSAEGLAKFSLTLLSALRGSIRLYQGEELGLPEAEIAGDGRHEPGSAHAWPPLAGRDGCRTPMVWEELAVYAGFSRGRPWLPIPEGHRKRAVTNQEYDPASVLAHYRNALAFRRRHPALATGDIRFLEAPEGMLAFVRMSGRENMLCLFNFAETPGSFRPEETISRAEFIDAPGFPAPAAGAAKDVLLQPLGAAFGILP